MFLNELEDTARYAGLLLAPAEGFGLRPRLFLPFGQKKEAYYDIYNQKCYPLSFPILGGRDSTRALQSSPFQKYENLKKTKKFTFFQKKKNFEEKKIVAKKKKNAILLVFQYYEDAIRPMLSSPPPFRIQGGSPERDIQTRTNKGRTKEILVSNFGYQTVCFGLFCKQYFNCLI